MANIADPLILLELLRFELLGGLGESIISFLQMILLLIRHTLPFTFNVSKLNFRDKKQNLVVLEWFILVYS